jgi:hypothetical protein
MYFYWQARFLLTEPRRGHLQELEAGFGATNMTDARRALACVGFLAALLIVFPARASYLVTLDTSNLSGLGALAFDLIDGDLAVPSTTVTISSFSPTVPLGSATFNGLSTSNLSTTVTFSDTDPFGFNEYLQQVTLGSEFSFVLDVTGLSGDFHDALSLFITDPTGLQLLVSTGGLGNALLTWDVGVTDPLQPQVFVGTVIDGNGGTLAVPITATAVPEPGVLTLVSAALLALGIGRFAGQARIRVRPAVPA